MLPSQHENQMEKNMENEMESMHIYICIRMGYLGFWFSTLAFAASGLSVL